MSSSTQVIFLANAYSPHVTHWIQVLARNLIHPVVFTIHEKGVGSKIGAPVMLLLKNYGWMPTTLRYIFAGLYIRFFMGKKSRLELFHAHNTSGYGLMAYLSGAPYILTTYGSEIFSANQKGWLYKAVIRKILHKAIYITGTTEAMAHSLMYDFGVSRNKITIFSLGLEGPFVYSKTMRQQERSALNVPSDDTPIFFANRRIHPHYNVVPLVRAFRTIYAQQQKGLLLLLEGDSDKQYLKLVEQEMAGCDAIKIIRGFIDQQQLCAYLCASDFVVSIPNSDQLSSSILEAAACMNVPILSDIDAYDELFRVEGSVRLMDLGERAIAEKLFSLVTLGHAEILAAKNNFYKFCTDNYSAQVVDERISDLYKLDQGRVS